jgi:2-polyprenyl-3-methyl-5-hydroxy-6-metoxy-1,4-benzoquinol methylase
MVEDGDWDKAQHPIKETIIYQSLYDMIVNNAPWASTPLYYYIMERIKRNVPQWGCENEEHVKLRGELLCNLCKDIREAGFIKTQKELKTYWPTDEIYMSIDRDGKFVFANNGTHRFFISHVIGLKRIHVRIYRRHKQWEDFRAEVYAMCDKFWKGKSYHKIPHPDFDEIQPIWSDERYDIVKPHIGENSKTVLDIGSLFGNMCHKFELNGYDCTAVESSLSFLRVMTKLRDASNMKFAIFPKSIFELQKKEYDVVLAFNIFHHFLKNKEDCGRLVKFLNELVYKEMYVQFHETHENQMVDAYKNYTPDEFAAFILANSKGKTGYKCIGEEHTRKIYKIY